MTFQETSFTTSQAIMTSITVILTLVSIFGNGAFLAIFARFKEIRRNFTNILIANLAVVDCLNALFNIPLFTMYIVVQTNWLEGKNWAIFSSSLQLEFVLLNLVSMAALMLDRFLAVYLGVKYFTWKTIKKAKIAVFLMWMASTILVALCSVPLFYMDIDGVPLLEARGMIFQKRKVITAPSLAFFTVASTVLGILTGYSIHQQKKQRMQLNLPPLAAEARLQLDIKATITVAMAVAMYYVCYIPAIAFAIWRRDEEQRISNLWVAFMLAFCPFVSGALNPVIYVSRNRRNRSAFRQLLKDPCGTSAYQENPIREENKAKKLELKQRQIKDDAGSCRDPEAGPSQGCNTRRPTSVKIQVHQSHGGVKKAWERNEEGSGSLSAYEQVVIARKLRRGGEKVQDEEEGESSGSVGDKSKHMNAVGRKEGGTSPGVVAREPRETLEKVQDEEGCQSSGSVEDKSQNTNAAGGKEGGTSPGVVAREPREGCDKKQDEGEGESSGSVRKKREKMNTASRKVSGTSPGVVAREPRNDCEKVHDEKEGESAGSVENKSKRMNAAGRKEGGTSPGLVARELREGYEKVKDEGESESSDSAGDKSKKMNAARRKEGGTSPGVVVREPRNDCEKVQDDKEGQFSGSVGNKSKKMNAIGRKEGGTSPGVVDREPRDGCRKVQVEKEGESSGSVEDKSKKMNAAGRNEGGTPLEVVAREPREGFEKVQDEEGGESSGSVGDKGKR